MTNTPRKLPKLPVNLRPGFIAAGTFYRFSTPAQIQAFAIAEMDRMDFSHGVASEQHIPEPPRGSATVRPPKPEGAMDLGGWYDAF